MSSYEPPSEAFSTNPYASPVDADVGSGTFEESARLLRATQPWVLMFGIVSLLFAGLALLGSIGMAFAAVMGAGTPLFVVMLLAYVLGAAAYVLVGYWLIKYGMAAGAFGRLRNVDALNTALRAQKAFWKTAGILFIVGIVLYFAMFIVMFAVGFQGFDPQQMNDNPWEQGPPVPAVD